MRVGGDSDAARVCGARVVRGSPAPLDQHFLFPELKPNFRLASAPPSRFANRIKSQIHTVGKRAKPSPLYHVRQVIVKWCCKRRGGRSKK